MFSASTNNQTEAQLLKTELLEYIKNLDRGVGVTDEQKDTVDSMCKKLELLTPTAKPLSSPLLSGSSTLLYTTQGSIIGAGRPAFLRPYGPIYQILDIAKLKVRNQETAPFYNSIKGDLTVVDQTTVAIQFTFFKVFGFIPIPAPSKAKGDLQVTYLDENLRISRSGSGTNYLYILATKDRNEKP